MSTFRVRVTFKLCFVQLCFIQPVESEIWLDEVEDGVYLKTVIHSIVCCSSDYGGQILLGWGMLEI